MSGQRRPWSEGYATASATAMRWIRDRYGVDARPGCSCTADTTVSAGIGRTKTGDLPNPASFRGHGSGYCGPGAGPVGRYLQEPCGVMPARSGYACAMNGRSAFGNRSGDICPPTTRTCVLILMKTWLTPIRLLTAPRRDICPHPSGHTSPVPAPRVLAATRPIRLISAGQPHTHLRRPPTHTPTPASWTQTSKTPGRWP